MRNAFDDLSAVSMMLREHERMGTQFRTAIEKHEQSVRDLMGSQASRTWNNVVNWDAANSANLLGAGGIDRNFFSTSVEAANTSISRMLADLRTGFELPKASPGLSKDWFAPAESFRDGMLGIMTVKKIESHIAELAGMSLRAESFLANLVPDRIGQALGISDGVRDALSGKFLDLSGSYQGLIESFEKSHTNFLSLQPSLVRMPTVEYYNGAVLTRSVTISEEEVDDLDGDDVFIETRDALDGFLTSVNPKLVELLRGARRALESRNPDRIRHVSISLRELFTHVLHALAPDDQVKKWSSSPEYYHNGQPTRRARLRYISRRIDQKPFEDFVDKDIDALLEFLQLFHGGVHKLESNCTSVQLKALQIRMESTIRFLFEVSSHE